MNLLLDVELHNIWRAATTISVLIPEDEGYDRYDWEMSGAEESCNRALQLSDQTYWSTGATTDDWGDYTILVARSKSVFAFRLASEYGTIRSNTSASLIYECSPSPRGLLQLFDIDTYRPRGRRIYDHTSRIDQVWVYIDGNKSTWKADYFSNDNGHYISFPEVRHLRQAWEAASIFEIHIPANSSWYISKGTVHKSRHDDVAGFFRFNMSGSASAISDACDRESLGRKVDASLKCTQI